MENIQIVFFSGTGGTTKVVENLEKCFLSRNAKCTTTELDLHKNDYMNGSLIEEDTDCLILVFAVYAFDAPQPVYDWLKNLPEAEGMPVAVLSVSGGGETFPNTACRKGSIGIFESKGYNVFYERMFIMPVNVVFKVPKGLNEWLLRILPEKAEDCAEDILKMARRRTRPGFFSSRMANWSVSEKEASHKFGQNLKVDDSCTGCGWCETNCPRNNITMADGKPAFSDRCVICLRCFYGCPSKAISAEKYKSVPLKNGFSIEDIEKKCENAEIEPWEHSSRGLLYYPFRRYFKDIKN